ncbi:MAG: hypothetical protein HYV07_11575 [Deltaproteobacteria bacterium]|nr:hypothetical protein [Deltaproteobacteria bacterium]
MRARSLQDGRLFEGANASEVVIRMRDAEPANRRLSVEAYMETVRVFIGEKVDTRSPARFLESLSALGLLALEV